MISWTILAIGIGLFTSMGAFLMALWKLRSGALLFEPLVGGLRWIAIATMLLYICLIGAGTFAYLEAQKAEDSLCALRSDLNSRVISGEAYLKAHPEGFAGITAAEIQESIDNQKRTIGTLSNLNC